MAEQIVWTSPDGTSVVLTDEAAGYRAMANGTTGLRSVTYELTSSRYAHMDGATVDAIRTEANQPTLGLLLRADDEVDFRARTRQLVRAMRPKAGLGTISVSNETGETRSLGCYCVGGLEGDEATDATLPGAWWKVLLRFFAPDPWWYGPEQTLEVGLGEPVTFFPIFPLRLSSSTVQGEFTVDLSGSDAPSFPLWTVTGPGTALVLRNETTGREITVDTTLSAGQTLLIDTRPGFQSVRSGGVNLMGSVGSDPALWPLVDGVNEISVQLTGATGDSRISAQYVPQFAGI